MANRLLVRVPLLRKPQQGRTAIRHIQSTKRERARHLTVNPLGLTGVLFLHFWIALVLAHHIYHVVWSVNRRI